jgi:hypothetical protein
LGWASAKHLGIAEILEIGDGALVVEPGIEPRRAGGLEEIARGDEDQFAQRAEVAHALLDEMQVQVGVAIEQAGTQLQRGLRQDVARFDVGRVAEDADELFALGIAEEIEVERTWRAMRGIDLDRHAIRQARRKGAIAAGRIERAAAIAAQGEHALDDLGRGENLAVTGNVAGGSPVQKVPITHIGTRKPASLES